MKKNKRKKKIRFDRILIFLGIIALIILLINFILNLKIYNIYVYGNNFLTDQQIIEIAKVEDYPETIKNLSHKIKQNLEKNVNIKEAKVWKKNFTKLYIEVLENKPLFYYNSNNKTVLSDGSLVNEKYTVPTVLNYITDSYYNEFINAMNNLNYDVLIRISEIKFSPNDVDDNRFFLSMNDGNYVYININTFYKLNKYISIMENLPDKKGILYLDYGNNFEVIE